MAGAVMATATPAFAGTQEMCFNELEIATEFVSKIDNFANTRVELRPVEIDIFKMPFLTVSDLENLFGPAENVKPIGEVGDKLMTWIPLVTREFSVTDIQARNNQYCTYVSARDIQHELDATVDVEGKIVYRATGKKRTNR